VILLQSSLSPIVVVAEDPSEATTVEKPKSILEQVKEDPAKATVDQLRELLSMNPLPAGIPWDRIKQDRIDESQIHLIPPSELKVSEITAVHKLTAEQLAAKENLEALSRSGKLLNLNRDAMIKALQQKTGYSGTLDLKTLAGEVTFVNGVLTNGGVPLKLSAYASIAESITALPGGGFRIKYGKHDIDLTAGNLQPTKDGFRYTGNGAEFALDLSSAATGGVTLSQGTMTLPAGATARLHGHDIGATEDGFQIYFDANGYSAYGRGAITSSNEDNIIFDIQLGSDREKGTVGFNQKTATIEATVARGTFIDTLEYMEGNFRRDSQGSRIQGSHSRYVDLSSGIFAKGPDLKIHKNTGFPDVPPSLLATKGMSMDQAKAVVAGAKAQETVTPDSAGELWIQHTAGKVSVRGQGQMSLGRVDLTDGTLEKTVPGVEFVSGDPSGRIEFEQQGDGINLAAKGRVSATVPKVYRDGIGEVLAHVPSVAFVGEQRDATLIYSNAEPGKEDVQVHCGGMDCGSANVVATVRRGFSRTVGGQLVTDAIPLFVTGSGNVEVRAEDLKAMKPVRPGDVVFMPSAMTLTTAEGTSTTFGNDGTMLIQRNGESDVNIAIFPSQDPEKNPLKKTLVLSDDKAVLAEFKYQDAKSQAMKSAAEVRTKIEALHAEVAALQRERAKVAAQSKSADELSKLDQDLGRKMGSIAVLETERARVSVTAGEVERQVYQAALDDSLATLGLSDQERADIKKSVQDRLELERATVSVTAGDALNAKRILSALQPSEEMMGEVAYAAFVAEVNLGPDQGGSSAKALEQLRRAAETSGPQQQEAKARFEAYMKQLTAQLLQQSNQELRGAEKALQDRYTYANAFSPIRAANAYRDDPVSDYAVSAFTKAVFGQAVGAVFDMFKHPSGKQEIAQAQAQLDLRQGLTVINTLELFGIPPDKIATMSKEEMIQKVRQKVNDEQAAKTVIEQATDADSLARVQAVLNNPDYQLIMDIRNGKDIGTRAFQFDTGQSYLDDATRTSITNSYGHSQTKEIVGEIASQVLLTVATMGGTALATSVGTRAAAGGALMVGEAAAAKAAPLTVQAAEKAALGARALQYGKTGLQYGTKAAAEAAKFKVGMERDMGVASWLDSARQSLGIDKQIGDAGIQVAMSILNPIMDAMLHRVTVGASLKTGIIESATQGLPSMQGAASRRGAARLVMEDINPNVGRFGSAVDVGPVSPRMTAGALQTRTQLRGLEANLQRVEAQQARLRSYLDQNPPNAEDLTIAMNTLNQQELYYRGQIDRLQQTTLESWIPPGAASQAAPTPKPSVAVPASEFAPDSYSTGRNIMTAEGPVRVLPDGTMMPADTVMGSPAVVGQSSPSSARDVAAQLNKNGAKTAQELEQIAAHERTFLPPQMQNDFATWAKQKKSVDNMVGELEEMIDADDRVLVAAGIADDSISLAAARLNMGDQLVRLKKTQAALDGSLNGYQAQAAERAAEARLRGGTSTDTTGMTSRAESASRESLVPSSSTPIANPAISAGSVIEGKVSANVVALRNQIEQAEAEFTQMARAANPGELTPALRTKSAEIMRLKTQLKEMETSSLTAEGRVASAVADTSSDVSARSGASSSQSASAVGSARLEAQQKAIAASNTYHDALDEWNAAAAEAAQAGNLGNFPKLSQAQERMARAQDSLLNSRAEFMTEFPKAGVTSSIELPPLPVDVQNELLMKAAPSNLQSTYKQKAQLYRNYDFDQKFLEKALADPATDPRLLASYRRDLEATRNKLSTLSTEINTVLEEAKLKVMRFEESVPATTSSVTTSTGSASKTPTSSSGASTPGTQNAAAVGGVEVVAPPVAIGANSEIALDAAAKFAANKKRDAAKDAFDQAKREFEAADAALKSDPFTARGTALAKKAQAEAAMLNEYEKFNEALDTGAAVSSFPQLPKEVQARKQLRTASVQLQDQYYAKQEKWDNLNEVYVTKKRELDVGTALTPSQKKLRADELESLRTQLRETEDEMTAIVSDARRASFETGGTVPPTMKPIEQYSAPTQTKMAAVSEVDVTPAPAAKTPPLTAEEMKLRALEELTDKRVGPIIPWNDYDSSLIFEGDLRGGVSVAEMIKQNNANLRLRRAGNSIDEGRVVDNLKLIDQNIGEKRATAAAIIAEKRAAAAAISDPTVAKKMMDDADTSARKLLKEADVLEDGKLAYMTRWNKYKNQVMPTTTAQESVNYYLERRRANTDTVTGIQSDLDKASKAGLSGEKAKAAESLARAKIRAESLDLERQVITEKLSEHFDARIKSLRDEMDNVAKDIPALKKVAGPGTRESVMLARKQSIVAEKKKAIADAEFEHDRLQTLINGPPQSTGINGLVAKAKSALGSLFVSSPAKGSVVRANGVYAIPSSSSSGSGTTVSSLARQAVRTTVQIQGVRRAVRTAEKQEQAPTTSPTGQAILSFGEDESERVASTIVLYNEEIAPEPLMVSYIAKQSSAERKYTAIDRPQDVKSDSIESIIEVKGVLTEQAYPADKVKTIVNEFEYYGRQFEALDTEDSGIRATVKSDGTLVDVVPIHVIIDVTVKEGGDIDFILDGMKEKAKQFMEKLGPGVQVSRDALEHTLCTDTLVVSCKLNLPASDIKLAPHEVARLGTFT